MVRVVIDIPDNEYRTIKEMKLTLHTEMLKGSIKDWENANAILNLLESVKSGTVFPEGHGDLIDRDELFTEYPEIAIEPYINAPIVIEADKENGND